MQYEGSRVAFSIFGIPVYWYAILIVTGMVLAVVLSSKEVKRMGGDEDLIYDLALWVLPLGVVGARLYYVIFEWENYAGDLGKILDIRSGGLAIHGGIIAGLIVGFFFTRKRGIKFFALSDIIMIFLPLAQAIGRWGNFINNEAHGGPTDLPWGVIIDGQKYHPTFLYESIGDFLVFIFLWYFFRNKQKRFGQTTSLYLILYGILRYFVEGLRTDSLWVGSFRTAQLVSIAMVALGLIQFIVQSRKSNNQDSIMTQSQNSIKKDDDFIDKDLEKGEKEKDK